MKRMRSRAGFARAVTMAMTAVLLTACSTSASSTRSSHRSSVVPVVKITPVNATVHPPVSSLCGSKPLTIDYLAAYSTTWQTISYAEMEQDAAKCPNVKTSFVSANDSLQQQISDIDGAIAQHVSGLVIYPVDGQAELTAMRQAFQSGMAVVPFDNSTGGAAGQDYTTYVGLDLSAVGTQEADWLGRTLKGKGNVVYLGGPAGSSFTQDIFDAWKSTLSSKYPGISILTGAPVATDYTVSDTQSVMAGLFSRYSHIDAIESDYGAAGVGALRAFSAAHKAFPIFATIATDNQLGCVWKQSAAPGTGFYSLDGTTLLSQIAFRKALAAAAGTKDPESSTVTAFVSADTTAGKDPKCIPSLPPSTDLSGNLSTSALKALLG